MGFLDLTLVRLSYNKKGQRSYHLSTKVLWKAYATSFTLSELKASYPLAIIIKK